MEFWKTKFHLSDRVILKVSVTLKISEIHDLVGSFTPLLTIDYVPVVFNWYWNPQH